MTPHRFQGYGVGAGDVTVILERITHMRHIDPNGRIGTEIELDSGAMVRVHAYIGTVEDIIRKAALGKTGDRND